jgi:outer membrane murein-binding lipoprotein Lpp
MSFDAMVANIQDLLTREKEAGPVNGLEQMVVRQQHRSAIKRQLDQLSTQVQQLRAQVRDLPAFPPASAIRWAQAVQSLPNLAFLELDTTGLYSDAEIIHALVLNASGSVQLSVYAQASQPLSETTERLTGIAQGDLAARGGSLSDLIEQVRNALIGKYVLSYNLSFDAGKLTEATERLEQEDITIIGEDLMRWAMAFFGTSSYPKLEMLCKRIGHPLPEHPYQTALDRARGQQALLNAIANAITGIATPTSTVEPDSEEDEEHPF